ncbi:hypothetical protein EC991_009635, partial [Linnemannia zychae]
IRSGGRLNVEFKKASSTIIFKKSLLRQALGIPDFDLNGIVNFDTDDIADPEGDMRDIDDEDDD